MAITDAEIRALQRNLKELSSKEDGSLVRRIIKSKFSETGTVLFVGLGGMGSKTINEIKKIYAKEFVGSGRVEFLAVDTAEQDLNEITVGTEGGYVKTDEQFKIFDNNAIHLLENPPEEVRAWLGNLQPRPIDNTGAQATRQIGRIMLCGTQKYMDLKSAVSNKIRALRDVDSDITHPTHVVLVAGISGGTGSGTFIDVAYMIRDILTYYDNLMIPTKLWGCFYTPDVQKTVPEIAGDPVKWTNLRRNGYAALKELDYFMTNGSHVVGVPTVYTLRAPGGITVTSSKPIFDEGCAFIVSPNTMNTDVMDIVAATARSLIYMHQDVSNVAGNMQSILSSYSNAPGNVPTWLGLHVGVPSDVSKTPDAAGIDNTNYPAFMNYKYSSFGYNSVYFPRDEMMAYCANMVLTKVIDQWKNIDLLNQENVAAFASDHSIATIEQIVAAIKDIMISNGYNESDLRIDKVKNAQYWPKVIGGGFLGKVSGTNNTMECANLKASDKFGEFDTSEAYNIIVGTIANSVINELNSRNFMSKYGPFCCIAILTGYGDIEGCCDNFDTLIGQLNQVKKASNEHLDEVMTAMQNEASRLEADHNPTAKEIEVFIDACHEYSKACIENGIYNNFLEPVILGVKEKLKEFNNETFEIFVPVMETLTAMLNDDATIFVNSNHRYYAGGQSFGMDAYGILKSQAKKQQFEQVLGAGVSESAESVANRFATSMFDANSRERWIRFRESPEELADEIRNIFSEFFTPFVNNLLEKFMVLAYNNNALLNLNAERLDEIWNATPNTPDAAIRDTAINIAATQIANQLKNGSSVLTSYENGQGVLDELSTVNMLMLLDATPTLNNAIRAQFGGTNVAVGLIGSECKSVIKAIRFTLPIALPLIKEMKDFAQQYYTLSVDEGTASGRHLDERSQGWVEYLPELYGVDTVDYYVSNKGRNDLAISYPTDRYNQPINNDKQMYAKIREAVEYGLSMGYILESTNTAGVPVGYKILNITETRDNYESLFASYKNMLDNHESTDWTTALVRVSGTGNITYDYIELCCDNTSLQGRILAKPATPNDLKNLYRVVRSNMRLEKIVLGARDKYAKLFERLHNMKVYSERMNTFTNMIVYDVIKNDEVSKKWTYTYSETSNSKDLFVYTAQRNYLDIVSNVFHAFVSFCENVNEEMYSVICQYIDRLNVAGKRDLKNRDLMVKTINGILADSIFTNPVESERIKNINALRNGSDEKCYRLLYDMPVKYDEAYSVYNNLVNFYNELKERLNQIRD
ncbi:MAG: tubulin-like doman-containing protein [Eubacterium sp.]|nr:tubulin-like doman-containing protein [Eubacterium sp.]MCC8173580.1 tubulin-like doman-containing protein [Odoribacter sp.]